MPSINVLISEGRKVVREGLSALLEKHEGLRIVGEADDAASAMKLLDALDVNVVILLLPDLRSGAISETQQAIRIVREFANAHRTVKLIALTFGMGLADVRQLVAAGAAACLTKECTSGELVAAIRAAIDGRVYLSPQLTEQVVRRYVGGVSSSAAARQRALARRETEVLQRIAAGQSTKEIAYALQVGPKTIETHRRRIMQKLGRHSIAELTQYALAKGLITLTDHAEI